MTRKMFTVSGKFIVPGTRNVVPFSGRVFAESAQVGSKDLAGKLQEEFGWTPNGGAGKTAPRGYVFSADFALVNLQWKEHPIRSNAPAVDESVIEAAVIATGGVVSPLVTVEA